MWTLNKMHQVGELVAAVAVVVSLIFVGLQIRDNTIASEAATYQEAVGYDVEILLSLSSDPDMARIWSANSRNDPDGLTPDELEQARYHMAATIRMMENYYLQYEAGMLSDAGWEARKELINNFVRQPGFDKFLNGPAVPNFKSPFMEYVMRLRAEASDGVN